VSAAIEDLRLDRGRHAHRSNREAANRAAHTHSLAASTLIDRLGTGERGNIPENLRLGILGRSE